MVPAEAQELELRAHHQPRGCEFRLFGLTRSTGEIVTTLRRRSVDGCRPQWRFCFGALRRSSATRRAPIAVPYITGDISATSSKKRVGESSGIGDTRLRLSVNLIGGGHDTERVHEVPLTTLGASLNISAPTGQYDLTSS
jgi:hypothetical protein